jgi:hypothetical protein
LFNLGIAAETTQIHFTAVKFNQPHFPLPAAASKRGKF